MFRRVLVANRGEVAARIVRACRALGVEPVCVASDADMDAGYPYLREAAQCLRLGPGPAAQSYLSLEAVVQAARQSGCSAVHPGWGFLSENARFAALCAQHGIRFIGPAPETMDRMSRKVSARTAARAAGLPVVPGSEGLLADAEAAVRSADAIGYPVVLKADAGGGGRGIRRCCNAAEVRANFSEAAREAEAAFGSAALYLEKYLEGGRHVEIQIFGDGRGAAVHLGERECSIQRRHQKLLEESPSPAVAEAQRTQIGTACARAAGAWRYAGAGTMEFLLDGDGRMNFLEMNTRLQVEHSVTEEVTGLDLAQAQIRVAAGQGLPWSQAEIHWSGHAVEARINAEDPDEHFRPAPGVVKRFSISGEGVRVDTHLADGARIPPLYDSLMAKVIAHGSDRAQAIARLDAALSTAQVEGLPTTISLHRRILAHPEFRAGDYDTQWLERLLS